MLNRELAIAFELHRFHAVQRNDRDLETKI